MSNAYYPMKLIDLCSVAGTTTLDRECNRGCYYRKWLFGKTRTERVLFSGSAKLGFIEH